jgi:TP901 family phage tail tape measure protein
MLNQQLAQGIIGISIDMSKFNSDMDRVRSSLAGLGAGSGAASMASGVTAGIARGVAQGAAAMGTPIRQAVARAVSAGVADGAAAKAPAGMVGLGSLQMSGIKLQDRLAAAAAKAAADAARPPPGLVALGSLQMSGIKLKDDLAAAATRAEAQSAARAKALARAAARARAEAIGMASRAGMGALQGLGVGGFATSPAQMAGQVIGGGLKDAVTHAMDLEQTFVGLQRVSGASAENVDRFRRSIFEIGRTQAGVSIADLTDIATAGAKAGITDKEGMAGLETFTRGMAKVRNSVQGIGTEQLANDMTRMLNLFGKGTDYVQSFGSVLARMDNVSTSSASDILEMSKSLSGTFTSLGMTIPQVMAFSSVLSDVGLTNQQGASSFSQILRMMAADSAGMAEKIGVPIDVFQEKIRTDAMGALGMLIARFKELNNVDPIKAQEFIAGLGFRGVKTAGALQQLSSMFDQVRERTGMAIQEETTLGSLQAANNLNSTTAIANLQMLKNAYEELGNAIGEKTVKPLTALSKLALSVVNQIGKEPGQGGPGGRPTEPLSVMEGLQSAAMEAMDLVGGAIPNDPGFRAKLNEFRQRKEASIAAGDRAPLEAAASTAEERIAGLERARAGAAPEQASKIDDAIAAIRMGQAEAKFASPEGMAAAGKAFMAEVTRVPKLGAPLTTPEFGGLPGVDKFFQMDLADPMAAAQARFDAAADAAGAPGPWKSRRELTTPADFVGPPIPDKVRNALDKAAMEPRPFVDPDFVGPPIPKKVMDARDRAATRPFQSQMFSGGDEFARHMIQESLSDKDPMVAEQETTNKHLEEISKKLEGPADAGRGTIMRGRSKV